MTSIAATDVATVATEEPAAEEPESREPEGPPLKPARGQDRLEWASLWAARGAPPPPSDVVRRMSHILRGCAYAYREAKGDTERAECWNKMRQAARIYHVCRVRQLTRQGVDLDAWSKDSEGGHAAGSVADLIASANGYAEARRELVRAERRFRKAAEDLLGESKPRHVRRPKSADATADAAMADATPAGDVSRENSSGDVEAG